MLNHAIKISRQYHPRGNARHLFGSADLARQSYAPSTICQEPHEGHPIIFLSSFNFLTRIHRALSAFEKTISRTASLSLDSNPAPNRYRYPAYFFSVAHHPLSRLQKFSERGPEYCPPRGPLASTLLTGVLSRPQNGRQHSLTGRLCSISAWHFAR